MGGFATNGVNMTKLESYQRGASFAATEFYADIEGQPGDPAVDRALEELKFHTKWMRVLGTYAQARARPMAEDGHYFLNLYATGGCQIGRASCRARVCQNV